MNTDELKDWMSERFEAQHELIQGINKRLDTMNGKVTSHDRWLWLMRGVVVAIATALGFIGVKVRF